MCILKYYLQLLRIPGIILFQKILFKKKNKNLLLAALTDGVLLRRIASKNSFLASILLYDLSKEEQKNTNAEKRSPAMWPDATQTVK